MGSTGGRPPLEARRARAAEYEANRTDPDYWVRKAEDAIRFDQPEKVPAYLALARYWRDAPAPERPAARTVPERPDPADQEALDRWLRETPCWYCRALPINGSVPCPCSPDKAHHRMPLP